MNQWKLLSKKYWSNKRQKWMKKKTKAEKKQKKTELSDIKIHGIQVRVKWNISTVHHFNDSSYSQFYTWAHWSDYTFTYASYQRHSILFFFSFMFSMYFIQHTQSLIQYSVEMFVSFFVILCISINFCHFSMENNFDYQFHCLIALHQLSLVFCCWLCSINAVIPYLIYSFSSAAEFFQDFLFYLIISTLYVCMQYEITANLSICSLFLLQLF